MEWKVSCFLSVQLSLGWLLIIEIQKFIISTHIILSAKPQSSFLPSWRLGFVIFCAGPGWGIKSGCLLATYSVHSHWSVTGEDSAHIRTEWGNGTPDLGTSEKPWIQAQELDYACTDIHLWAKSMSKSKEIVRFIIAGWKWTLQEDMMALCLLETTQLVLCLRRYDDYFHFSQVGGKWLHGSIPPGISCQLNKLSKKGFPPELSSWAELLCYRDSCYAQP